MGNKPNLLSILNSVVFLGNSEFYWVSQCFSHSCNFKAGHLFEKTVEMLTLPQRLLFSNHSKAVNF